MSDIRVSGGRTVTRISGNDRLISPRAGRDGTLFTEDWFMGLAAEGKMYSATIGTAATPVSFAKTAYDADQPQLVVDVPTSKAIIPYRSHLALQDSAGTDTIWAMLASDVNVGAGTSTAFTPINHHTEGDASSCSAYTLYTGNGTDPATGTERWMQHKVYAFADSDTSPVKAFDWNWRDNPTVLVGAASWTHYVVATTTAPAGYLVATWVEVDDEDLN